MRIVDPRSGLPGLVCELFCEPGRCHRCGLLCPRSLCALCLIELGFAPPAPAHRAPIVAATT